ncbi:MAG: hypothetical protein RBQ94_02335, partial [Methanimicrococcus sp.]|nr:hypothetical protein [Methanimicrococcus sp.]
GWNNTTGDGKIYSKDIINETPVTEDTIYQVVFKEKSGGGTGNGTIIDPSESERNPSENGEDGSQSSGSVSGGSQSSGSASNGSQSSGSGSTTDPLKPGMAGAGGTTLLFPLAIAFFLFYVKREGDLD